MAQQVVLLCLGLGGIFGAEVSYGSAGGLAGILSLSPDAVQRPPVFGGAGGQ